MLCLVGLLLPGCATLVVPYKQEFKIISQVPDISVSLTPTGSIWNASIINNSDKTIKFLIDESCYVTTDGRVDRLIRGQTRKISSDRSQPTMSIPSKARYNDFLIPEKFASLDDYSLMYPPNPVDLTKKAKIYLIFEINGEKKTWSSEIQFIKQ